MIRVPKLRFREFVLILHLCLSIECLYAEGSRNEIIRRVEKSLVHIQSRQRPDPLRPELDPNYAFFKTQLPQNSSRFPLGTGFFIEPLGTIATSFALIAGHEELEVLTADKKTLRAVWVGGDRASDFALLKVSDTRGIRSLDYGDSQRVELGDTVLAFGFPLGHRPLVVSGMIAAKGGVLGLGNADRHFIVQLPYHAGYRGGPLVDTRGRVVGLMTHAEGASEVLSFAIPSAWQQSLKRDLVQTGKVKRAWLGMVAKNLSSTDSLSEAFDPKVRSGVLVENLIVEGPAMQAGLLVGDLLLKVDDKPILAIPDLEKQVRSKNPGDSLKLEIFRRQKGTLSLKLRLGESPKAEDLPDSPDLY